MAARQQNRHRKRRRHHHPTPALPPSLRPRTRQPVSTTLSSLSSLSSPPSPPPPRAAAAACAESAPPPPPPPTSKPPSESESESSTTTTTTTTTTTLSLVLSELREQSRTSLPAVLGMVLYKIPWLLSLGFVGRVDVDGDGGGDGDGDGDGDGGGGASELAAAALATALCDVTGMSLSVGLSSAVTTLAGQARGEMLSRAAAAAAAADADAAAAAVGVPPSSRRSRSHKAGIDIGARGGGDAKARSSSACAGAKRNGGGGGGGERKIRIGGERASEDRNRNRNGVVARVGVDEGEGGVEVVDEERNPLLLVESDDDPMMRHAGVLILGAAVAAAAADTGEGQGEGDGGEQQQQHRDGERQQDGGEGEGGGDGYGSTLPTIRHANPPSNGRAVAVGGGATTANETQSILDGGAMFRPPNDNDCTFDDIARNDDSSNYGNDNVKPILPLTYLYRGIFVQLCLVLPVGVWWLYGIGPLIRALGQPEDLAGMTETYLRILTPGLWSCSINWTLSAWLQAIEMADVPPLAAGVGCLIHVPANLFFIHTVGLGWLGVAVATVTFQVVQPVLMVLYVFGTAGGRRRLLVQTGAAGIGRTGYGFASFRAEVRAAVCSLRGIGQYLRLAVPGILVVSEWWASEVAIFLGGNLRPNPEVALSGMAIYQTINSSCFVLPVGTSVGGSTRVSNLLGANDPRGAALASGVCVGSAAVLSCAMGTILYVTPHWLFPSLFSPGKDDVIEETAGTITLLSLYVAADGVQVALNGIVKGCGRQCITVPIVLTAYWVVGVPLAYYLSFVRHMGYQCNDGYFCGIVGLVGGMTVGTWIHFLLLWAVVAGTTDWEREAEKAQDRMALEEQQRAGVEKATGIRTGLTRGAYVKDDDESIASMTSM